MLFSTREEDLERSSNARNKEQSTMSIPRIPLNLYDHKTSIAIQWTVLLLSSGFIPVMLYFVLKYVAHAKLAIVIGIPSAIFGVVSLPSLLRRTWSLFRANSTTRPIGAGRWALDYFNWNFAFGFCYITALIVYSTASKPGHVRTAALPLTLLLFQVCGQLIIVSIMRRFHVQYFFRVSSMTKGDGPVRPAVYTIGEDIVAVEGGGGTKFREQFNERYLASATVRTLMARLELLWGVSGVAVAIVLIVLIFKLKNEDVSWTIGWTVPWAWAAICAMTTILWTRSALKWESAL